LRSGCVFAALLYTVVLVKRLQYQFRRSWYDPRRR